MHITEDTTRHIAGLARLELTPAELTEATADLNRLSGYLSLLNELDTTGAEPFYLPLSQVNILREDVPAPSLPRDTLLAGAPEADGQLFLVPRSVE